jgi:hypothetical protein
MRKRVKFVISAVVLAFGLVGTQLLSLELRPIAIILFFIASYLISAWALSKDLNGVEWITVIPFPALYALSVSLFYFLLPSNLFARVAIIVLFGIGMYALYLTSNIFTVGKVKTIQLLHAAHAVGSLFLLIMSIFFFNFIFSLQLHPVLNALLVALVTFVPVLCRTWSLDLQPKFTPRTIAVPLLFSAFLGEAAFALSLLPVGLWTVSLFLTALLYIETGLIQNYVAGRLFAKTMQEYIMMGVFVTMSLLLLISWK